MSRNHGPRRKKRLNGVEAGVRERQVEVKQKTLLSYFRDHRFVPGPWAQGMLNVSERTLIRYVKTLRAAGHDIRGQAGVGYLYRPVTQRERRGD